MFTSANLAWPREFLRCGSSMADTRPLDPAAKPCAYAGNKEESMTLTYRFDRTTITPEITRPETVLAGDPVHTTWSMEEDGNLFAGMWQSTPGKWETNYTEWEYVHIHAGHSVLTDTDGVETHLRAGDSWLIRKGFKGTWEVLETTLKDYVILA